MPITAETLSAGPEGAALLIRTNFSSDELWTEVRDAATAMIQIDGREANTGIGYDAYPNVRPVDDPQFDGLTPEELTALPWPTDNDVAPGYYFVVDERTLADPEHPILAVNRMPYEEGEATRFRLIPMAMAMVTMNLSIANLGFDDYATSEEDGIVRFTGL